MEIIDNKSKILRDDLAVEMKAGSKLSIAAACFSIYAYQALKDELSQIDELRFIFTSPTFTTEKAQKEKREFYIPRLTRERSLYGTDFEVKLRNELNQKAIAKECAEWIRNKVTFKSNKTSESMQGFINLDDTSYSAIDGFTTIDLGCERGDKAYNIVTKMERPYSECYIDQFNSLWNDDSRLQEVTDVVIDNITAAYNENSPNFIYFVTLYNIFNEFLEDISEDTLPNEATGFKESKIWKMLYNFQKDAALSIINKLEKYNGCILADSVGLGKTFTALAVIKYYENRNKSVLVLCPKKLMDNWNTYKSNYKNNPIADDRLRYDVLYHTDLSRKHGYSNGIDLSMINWGNYDLVVIDESHNFRNGGKTSGEFGEKKNRYLELLDNVVRAGVKTKVLMLSATPVNNRFNDLKNQLALAYEGNAELIDEKLNTKRSIDDIFRNAQKAFNEWSEFEPQFRTTERLLKMLDFDFFEVLDSVTIARSRKHIQKYYDTTAIGAFPERLKPISRSPELTDVDDAVDYNDIFEKLMSLHLSVYTPSRFVLPSKKEKYADLYGDNRVNVGFTQANREQGIRHLMAINLMKRMESSVYSFGMTIKRIEKNILDAIASIEDYEDHKYAGGVSMVSFDDFEDELDSEDQDNGDIFTVGRKVKIDIADMDYISWRQELSEDLTLLYELMDDIEPITPEHDAKLLDLRNLIRDKINNPINPGNKKVIIFTAFSDTAEYLYNNLREPLKNNYGLDSAIITGTVEGRSTIPGLTCNLNNVLTYFSPVSKRKDLLVGDDGKEIDVLIATDCISEGQNLQDCDYLINYDIHWNPVRIVQRFGRIDRIGSKNKVIQLVNFWPNVSLDAYIDLKSRVETRMKIVDMTATGDDNILSEEERTDLEYRKEQLQRLREEVVDMEDVSSGISIMDLGLNEFRLDLLDYVKRNPDLDKAPFGLHAVTNSDADAPSGVVFVLKNRSNSVNINSQNRLHPFYLVYISDNREIICDHLSPKDLLDKMRLLCKDKVEPIPELYREFNKETKNGKDMRHISDLLSSSISSIVEVKDESDIDSFLNGDEVDFSATSKIKGIDDFELICFLVVR